MTNRIPIFFAALALAAPAQLPAQQAIAASDKAQGAAAHPQLLAEFGGVYAGRQADYVRRVGQRIAVQSELSNAQSDFTVSLLNSSANNAFAIPGGYVYITRQLLALMNDEAELASVMGHEVGHVAARHSRARSQTSAIGGLLAGVVGAVAGNSTLGSLIGRGAGLAAQAVTLKFSRSQEFQADDLGVTYLSRGGYDPLASASMLYSLAAQGTLDARLSGQRSETPGWASTHPDPASRVARAVQSARATGKQSGLRNRETFLAAIDGMVYGDDPKQGVVDGTVFRHPVLRVMFTAPEGYAIANGSDAVTVAGTGGQAQFSTGRFDGNLDAYVRSVFAAAAGGSAVDIGGTRRGQVGGLETATATLRANTEGGPVDATVIAYAIDARTAYHFLMVTPAGSGAGPFAGLAQSLRRMTTAEAAAVRARRVQVVTVGPRDTVATLSARMAYPDLRSERFQVLNAIRPGEQVRAGQKVKLIVFG